MNGIYLHVKSQYFVSCNYIFAKIYPYALIGKGLSLGKYYCSFRRLAYFALKIRAAAIVAMPTTIVMAPCVKYGA